jgi:hypothetical protein
MARLFTLLFCFFAINTFAQNKLSSDRVMLPNDWTLTPAGRQYN